MNAHSPSPALRARAARLAAPEVDVDGPRDGARCDRWLLCRPPGDKGHRGAEQRKFIRGTDANLQVWLGGVAAVGVDRVLPFLEVELCALEDLRQVDPSTAHVRFVTEAGCKCARHQSQHMLFTAESGKLLAFEVLTGATQGRTRTGNSRSRPTLGGGLRTKPDRARESDDRASSRRFPRERRDDGMKLSLSKDDTSGTTSESKWDVHL